MDNLWRKLAKILFGVSLMTKKNSKSRLTDLAKRKIDEAIVLYEKQSLVDEKQPQKKGFFYKIFHKK